LATRILVKMPLFTTSNASEDHETGDGRDGRERSSREEVDAHVGVGILENTAGPTGASSGTTAARLFAVGHDFDFSSLQSLLLGPREGENASEALSGPRGMAGSSSLLATRLARERAGGGERLNVRSSNTGTNAVPSTSLRGTAGGNEASGGNVAGGTVLGQLLSSPWVNNMQPRTGRRRSREGVDRGASTGGGGGDGDDGSGDQRRAAGSGRSFPPPLTAFIHAADSAGGSERVVEFPIPESFSLPTSFALPILGSREMTELFNELFDSSRQEARRSRARRDEPNAANVTNAPSTTGNRRGAIGARSRRAGSAPEGVHPAEIMRNMDRIEGQRYRSALQDDEQRLFDSAMHAFSRAPNSTGSHPSGGKLVRSPPNWFLKPGQTWSGWQHVQHWPPGTSERWSVRVVLDFVNFEKGEVFGTMTASNVPGAENNVVTYFEGEIIDNENSTFYSNPDASARMCLAELRHWSRFPSFRPLRDSVLEEDGRAPALAESGKVFMRWKEKCFLSGGADCRLTIAGLYYVTLDRINGDVHAYYWDPNSAPEQKMNLKVGSANQQGYSLPMHKVA
jgi:hypothetical protein